MAGSVNKVILIGNLGADPEVRRMPSGDAVVNLRLATTESWRDKASGERKDKTEWHRVVIFNENLAKIAEQYLKKGSKVYIEGQLQTRKYTDKDGVEKFNTEIVLQRYRGELTLMDSRGSGRRGLRRARRGRQFRGWRRSRRQRRALVRRRGEGRWWWRSQHAVGDAGRRHPVLIWSSAAPSFDATRLARAAKHFRTA